MIVATRAGDGQPQETARNGIDAIVQFVSAFLRAHSLIRAVALPKTLESQSAQAFLIIRGRLRNQITRQLQTDELVIRQIAIEGTETQSR